MSDMSFPFSPQQVVALDAVKRWLADPCADQVFRLFGYAGTGKTTIVKHLAAQVNGEVAFAAFTGKAAMTMVKSGCANATTIHALIYTPRKLPDGRIRFVVNRKGRAATAKVIVIDEVSMVNEQIAEDILSLNVPVLVLGDPGQLPPPKGVGYFTEGKPDIMLTEIHRQAAENPILSLATAVREGRRLTPGTFGNSVVRRKADLTNEDLLAVDQVLVGSNKMRVAMNTEIRALLGKLGRYPVVGDRLVCLRNNHDYGLLNGGIFKVSAQDSDGHSGSPLCLGVKSEDIEGLDWDDLDVSREIFDNPGGVIPTYGRWDGELFDYGYALTVHKAQGSQWSSVLVFDESHCFRDERQRWLYTALTRAADQVMLFID